MASLSFDTQHAEMIHDAQADFYGKRLATASSDRTIKIWNNINEKPEQSAELRGHEGPVWQVSWAHPRFGSLLASCSYDRKVIVWREVNHNEWQQVYVYTGHSLSVNSIAWAPQEFGLALACGSSDGSISILSVEGESWASEKFPAHSSGVNAVSWSVVLSGATPLFRLASGGSDNVVKIWRISRGRHELEESLSEHKNWVRDVAWASNIGLPYYTLASCDQDGVVIIWSQDHGAEWQRKTLPLASNGVVWRLSWSLTGNVLAVTGSDNRVTLWKQSLDQNRDWKLLSQMDEEGVQEYASS